MHLIFPSSFSLQYPNWMRNELDQVRLGFACRFSNLSVRVTWALPKRVRGFLGVHHGAHLSAARADTWTPSLSCRDTWVQSGLSGVLGTLSFGVCVGWGWAPDSPMQRRQLTLQSVLHFRFHECFPWRKGNKNRGHRWPRRGLVMVKTRMT